MKRAFDLVIASIGLILLSPLFFLVSIFIKLDSPGPVFFRQERIGKKFRPFHIYKFRTMVDGALKMGSAITPRNDARITRLGSFLRRTKIDELPQLINVLIGDMSLVGPRPEVLRYVELFRSDYEEILKVRPGITDIASLKYRNEADLLGAADDLEEKYVTRVLPDKIKLAKEYVGKASFLFDLKLVLRTIFKMFEFEKSY